MEEKLFSNIDESLGFLLAIAGIFGLFSFYKQLERMKESSNSNII